jgi:hypothetical protein
VRAQCIVVVSVKTIVTPCCLVERYQRFGSTLCLHWYQHNKICSVCSVIMLSQLSLSSQNFVIWIMPWTGKLTYRSFISSVINLWFSLARMLCRSSATSCEFFVVYVFGKFTNCWSFFIKEFSSFVRWCWYVVYHRSYGSVLLVCYYIGVQMWCRGFYVHNVLMFGFSINVLHFCRACWICFWKHSVGSLFRYVIWFSCMNFMIFCSSVSLLITTMVLLLSALAIVRLFL